MSDKTLESVRRETKKRVRMIKRLTKGRFFSVEFIKRTDGTRRRMLCRTGVTKGLKGGELPFDPERYGLMVVWDVQKQAYRLINLVELQSFQFGGFVWRNLRKRLTKSVAKKLS